MSYDWGSNDRLNVAYKIDKDGRLYRSNINRRERLDGIHSINKMGKFDSRINDSSVRAYESNHKYNGDRIPESHDTYSREHGVAETKINELNERETLVNIILCFIAGIVLEFLLYTFMKVDVVNVSIVEMLTVGAVFAIAIGSICEKISEIFNTRCKR